jgi:hypothetical protein
VLEKKLLDLPGNILELPEVEQNIIQKPIIQRELVKTNKFF